VTEGWLLSYLALCGLVAVACALLIVMLRQIGLVRHRPGQHATGQIEQPPPVPPLEQDGPAIGSYMPDLAVQTINGFERVVSAALRDGGDALLVFISPICESCQHVVGLLNDVVVDGTRTVQPIAIMRADHQACQAFTHVFPLRLPLICDAARTIHVDFDIHRAPFGLLYDRQGMLVRKGIIVDRDDLLALLGDTSAPTPAQEHVFPKPQPQFASS